MKRCPKKILRSVNLIQPALQLKINHFNFFAMALNEVLGLLLPVASTLLGMTSSSGAAVALQCQSVAAAGIAPGPARLTSP